MTGMYPVLPMGYESPRTTQERDRDVVGYKDERSWPKLVGHGVSRDGFVGV